MTRPLCIAQILPELNVGGVEQGVIDSARGYVARGHRSLVISGGGGLVETLEAEGSTHHTLPVHKKSLMTAWRMVGQVAALLEREKADLLHARSRVPAWIGYYAARRAGVPFVTTVHGFYSKPWYSRVMARGERVIAVSRGIADYAVKSLGADPERLRVIHRGTDPERFDLNWDGERVAAKRRALGLPESGRVVTVIGRITRLKGHSVLIDALAKLSDLPDVTLLVAGSAPPKKAALQAELTAQVARLGLAGRVVFAGSRKDVDEVLQVSDLLVNCSIQPESFGRTLIEAMAAGKPVIASAHGGALDIVEDGVCGYLVPPGDAGALAEAVRRVMSSTDGGAALGAAGRERVVKNFSVDRMVEKTLEVYAEVCPETGSVAA
ncbi:MAG: glycosyltransferase family 4 protein [Leptospirillia bacterium]